MKKSWLIVGLIVFLGLLLPLLFFLPGIEGPVDSPKKKITSRTHTDHSFYFKEKFNTPGEVTKACLKCHPKAAKEVMKTVHWTWLSGEAMITREGKEVKIGKQNVINNFCLSVVGNWGACTKCHAGYGWKDAKYDFSKSENVDCLVCHDWSLTYEKGNSGMPLNDVDLLTVAKSVGYTKRSNCGFCHFYGGGGVAVKHGDLDDTLVNPNEGLDVHMGKHDMLCTDCHRVKNHQIFGKAFSTCNCPDTPVIGCVDCHEGTPHKDTRINSHIDHIACQTCHIPVYAKKVPTKMFWDWSKAGDSKRKEEHFTYLKAKGEFIYEKKVRPEYYWFNLSIDRYLVGEKINENGATDINAIKGSIDDPKAKIWPFKVHRAVQPFDLKYKYFLPPDLSGEGGYWHDFDWDKAFRLGAKASGIKYSGKYGFAESRMFWPLSHMVSVKADTLQCADCHDSKGVLDWKALGYQDDPIKTGGKHKTLKK